jgi:hypothetical protein
MCFVFIYENIIKKLVEILLRSGGVGRMRDNDRGGESNRYIVSTYVNITMYPPIKLLYDNEK